ncbi:RNA-binding region-containing protein 3-like [Anopheles bellator]|uniref:RNA-binding region-containing protein 3-like n=1 Tax=Anopheles bellator TaxID=139047 RepID=UPI002648D7EE|nr:RNA-binding region-containing protein 3-like [Anopheles bellator]
MSPIALRIFNFPPLFTNVDVREYLHLFGLEIKHLYKRRAAVCALVYVSTEAAARLVIARLHQLLIISHRLKVEYSEVAMNDAEPDDAGEISVTAKRKTADSILQKSSFRGYEGFPPPCLMYRYPKASSGTLNKISRELSTNVAFYYQVLHLMNKMNLTPPFETLKGSSENLQTLNLASHSLHSASDDESELESDTENISLKRLKPATSISLPRTMKVVNYDCPTEPLVCVKQQKVSKLEIHLSGTSVVSSRTPNSEETLKITSGNCAPHSESAPVTDGPRSLDDILQNRIPDEQRALLNVFQNYTPGEPSDKLYIKNLSKHVTEQDLKKIFDLFFEQDVLRVVDVKLMKTGRMKGQAFVSFVSVSADKADELKKIVANVLSVTNGYILKDKPMVISYAKSSKSQD